MKRKFKSALVDASDNPKVLFNLKIAFGPKEKAEQCLPCRKDFRYEVKNRCPHCAAEYCYGCYFQEYEELERSGVLEGRTRAMRPRLCLSAVAIARSENEKYSKSGFPNGNKSQPRSHHGAAGFYQTCPACVRRFLNQMSACIFCDSVYDRIDKAMTQRKGTLFDPMSSLFCSDVCMQARDEILIKKYTFQNLCKVFYLKCFLEEEQQIVPPALWERVFSETMFWTIYVEDANLYDKCKRENKITPGCNKS